MKLNYVIQSTEPMSKDDLWNLIRYLMDEKKLKISVSISPAPIENHDAEK
jgi:MoaA/NifB/PqqE/SkfB family radical SAM enzyme